MPATVTVKDLTPRWLKFHELARDAQDPDQRWQLWHEHYRFAAVPPTEQGMQRARQMLDESFDRYSEALDVIRAGAAGFQPVPQAVLDEVCRVLGFDGEMTVECYLYVGNFENNAFAYTFEGVPRVHFPVETDGERHVTLAHEFAHVVHQRLSSGIEEYVVPIGVLAMREGIAMHTSKAVVPGRPDGIYLSFTDLSWVDRCAGKHRTILEGILPHLAEASQDAMWRFTMGTGTTGEGREVYYVGWHVVAHLLATGHTLAGLARLSETAAVVPLVQETVERLLK